MEQKYFQDIKALRASIPANKTITLVGGCFDLFHVGHLKLLEYASQQEDVLVVAVLSDKKVQAYKGIDRPIIPQHYRAQMVAACKNVTQVFITDVSPTQHETLSVLNPDSIVFGIEDDAKWMKLTTQKVPYLKNNFPHIKIHLHERFHDTSISTSGLIQKILRSRLRM